MSNSIVTRIVKRRTIKVEDYRFRAASADDFSELIDTPTRFYEGGELKIVYLQLEGEALEQATAMLPALDRVGFKADNRTDGLISNSSTFAYLPRVTIRRDFCTVSGMAQQNPHEHAQLMRLGSIVAANYEQAHPIQYRRHAALTKGKALPDYIIPGSPFTSGIVNKNNALNYHFDSGNYTNVWSGMIVLKRNVTGGYLSVPEYNVGFALRHGTLILFDGASLLHGVTPIQKLKDDGVRYSIVYYSLKTIWNCLPPGEELKRIQKVKTARTSKRAAAMSNLPMDMKAKPIFPVFIPSKGRASKAAAIFMAKTAGLRPFVVIEPQDEKLYRETHPDVELIVLPENNRGIVYVRQYILELARKKGIKRYWQVDDNIFAYQIVHERQTYKATMNGALAAVESLTLGLEAQGNRIALAGTDAAQLLESLWPKAVTITTKKLGKDAKVDWSVFKPKSVRKT